MNSANAHHCLGKYPYPGTTWYVMRNGYICYSGTLRECKTFLTKVGGLK